MRNNSSIIAFASFLILTSVVSSEENNNNDITCLSKELNHWNAIVFRSFHAETASSNTTTTAKKSLYYGIDGPLIIGSDATLSKYNINQKQGSNSLLCASDYTETIPIREYGLYLDNSAQDRGHIIEDVLVSGAIHINQNNKDDHQIESMRRMQSSCRFFMEQQQQDELENKRNSLMAEYERETKLMSAHFAVQRPTHVLTRGGEVLLVANDKTADTANTMDYHVFNFAPCNTENECTLKEDSELSDPLVFLNGVMGEWKGTNWPKDKVIVFNIPVDKDLFELKNTQDLMGGLSACRTIWNFFSADENGNPMESSQPFFLNRETDYLVGGTFLAPNGIIRDGTMGGFAGQLVAREYTWLDVTQGVSIRDFSAIDKNPTCLSKRATCWPQLTAAQTTNAATESSQQSKQQQQNKDFTMPQDSFLQSNNIYRGKQRKEYGNVKEEGNAVVSSEDNKGTNPTHTSIVWKTVSPNTENPSKANGHVFGDNEIKEVSYHPEIYQSKNEKYEVKPLAFYDAETSSCDDDITDYEFTVTVTKDETLLTVVTSPDPVTTVIYTTSVSMVYTTTSTVTNIIYIDVIATPTNFSFDLANGEIVTLYE